MRKTVSISLLFSALFAVYPLLFFSEGWFRPLAGALFAFLGFYLTAERTITRAAASSTATAVFLAALLGVATGSLALGVCAMLDFAAWRDVYANPVLHEGWEAVLPLQLLLFGGVQGAFMSAALALIVRRTVT
jgi:hypothetical protein